MVAVAHILETAAELVAQAQHRALSLREELDALELRRAAMETELRAAQAMAGRLANFQAHDGASFHCPRCWIEEESLSPLSMKKGGEWREAFLMCDLCTLEIRIGGE